MNFDSVSPSGVTGRIILTRFPGRDDADGFTEGRLNEVFQALVSQGCHTLVSLPEDSEFEAFRANPMFAEHVKLHHLTWHHLPIADYQIPDSEFLRQWKPVSESVTSELVANRHVCLHCKGGIGRSGTVAAMILIEHGESNEQAIKQVRRARKGAIETTEQEAFVRAYRP